MNNENISINICDEDNIDNDNNDNNDNLNSLLNKINDYTNSTTNTNNYLNDWSDETDFLVKKMDYELNYNVKQLMNICDYYGLVKEVRINKFKKEDIIHFLLDFEENPNNTLIVYKRKQMWHFMNELKRDPFMKKYILSW
jgi:hypothetical protein